MFKNVIQIPVHVCPFQEKPFNLHSHLNEPSVLVQFAVSSQVWNIPEHSSISAIIKNVFEITLVQKRLFSILVYTCTCLPITRKTRFAIAMK